MSEVRCFYLDSAWTQRNKNGSFSLVLSEQIEVPNAHVMYLDDVSVIGSIPMVNINNNKLYVVERTPQSFNFAGTLISGNVLRSPAEPKVAPKVAVAVITRVDLSSKSCGNPT